MEPNNFLLANHISAPGLNMVIEILFTFANSCMNICGAVGGKSIVPKAKSLHFVWPFLPYFGLGNRCWKKKRHLSLSLSLYLYHQELIVLNRAFSFSYPQPVCGQIWGCLLNLGQFLYPYFQDFWSLPFSCNRKGENVCWRQPCHLMIHFLFVHVL